MENYINSGVMFKLIIYPYWILNFIFPYILIVLFLLIIYPYWILNDNGNTYPVRRLYL